MENLLQPKNFWPHWLTVCVISSHFRFLSVIIFFPLDWFVKKPQQRVHHMCHCASVNVVTLATITQQSAAGSNPNATNHQLPRPRAVLLQMLSKCPPGQPLSSWVRFCCSKQLGEHGANFSRQVTLLILFPCRAEFLSITVALLVAHDRCFGGTVRGVEPHWDHTY